jgi:Fic family protein
LLLRAGIPDISSPILSNHYNNTREEYYRQLQSATETGDLTGFIKYALEGFRDGLEHDVLKVVHDDQIDSTWKNYVHDTTENLQNTEGKNEKIIRRIRQLAYYFPNEEFLTINQIKDSDKHIIKVYESLTKATLKSDLELLVKLELLQTQDGKYRGNKEILYQFMPESRLGINKHY